MKTKAIFLDRDGVINKFIYEPDGNIMSPASINQVEILPLVREGILKMKKLGFKVIVISNQPGVSFGYVKEEKLEEINSFLKNQLNIDEIYCCCHNPKEKCSCRKPNIGLIKKAESNFGVDALISYMVGDNLSDIQTGINAGVKKTFRIGIIREDILDLQHQKNIFPDYTLPNLLEVAGKIEEIENKVNDRCYEYLNFAILLARNAGNLLMGHYGKNRIVDLVLDNEKGLITQADLMSDQYIRKTIIDKFPEHSIITEENESIDGNDYEWIIDPLDGTNNFSRGDPIFSVSICLRHKKESIVGVIYFPLLRELYYASKGTGAYIQSNYDNKNIHVSGVISKKMINFGFGSGIDFHETGKCDNIITQIKNSGLSQQFRRRMVECSSYELCSIAAGRLDAYYNNFTHIWDVAAGELIVKEAGGNFSYVQNSSGYKVSIFASNGINHNKYLDIIHSNL